MRTQLTTDLTPDVTDVRMAMQDCGLLVPSLTGAEEIWKEILRKPLEDYDEDSGARAKEEERRSQEDAADVHEFIDWVKGDYNKEISRIAGTLKSALTSTEALDAVEMEDYLNSKSHTYGMNKWGSANSVRSSHEKAQQDWSRIAISGNSPRASWRP